MSRIPSTGNCPYNAFGDSISVEVGNSWVFFEAYSIRSSTPVLASALVCIPDLKNGSDDVNDDTRVTFSVLVSFKFLLSKDNPGIIKYEALRGGAQARRLLCRRCECPPCALVNEDAGSRGKLWLGAVSLQYFLKRWMFQADIVGESREQI